VGTHTATVTVSLVSNSAISQTASFAITIYHLCTTTSITTAPTSIENLVAFAGYTIASKVKYTFNDSVSISSTLSSDSVDFCGDKQLAF
jgi:hypothetical protein